MTILSNLNQATPTDTRSVLDRAPAMVGEAGKQLETLTQNGIDRARELGTTVRQQASHATERTVGYIQEQPVKAVLIAAAAGAAITLLASALTRRHGN